MASYATDGSGGGAGREMYNLSGKYLTIDQKALKKSQISMPFNLSGPLLGL